MTRLEWEEAWRFARYIGNQTYEDDGEPAVAPWMMHWPAPHYPTLPSHRTIAWNRFFTRGVPDILLVRSEARRQGIKVPVPEAVNFWCDAV